MDGLTAQVAAFAATLRLDDIPEAVRAKARLHLLDTIGCGIAGAGTSLARQAREFVALESGPGPCALLGTALRYPPAAAAFANAMAMNALDFDDGFEVEGRGMGHPGASIIAAALSGCAEGGVGGAELLVAVVAGYEVNNRLIHAIQPSPERFSQVYGVGQHQSVGAAIASARLAGLDPTAMENVIGFAATLANLPSLHKYNWDRRPLISLKDFCGPAAEAGVRAVHMHRCGLVGAKAVLDGENGLWRMLGSDSFEAAMVLDGLGASWTLWRNSIKPYPTCRWMHATLEAFETIAQDIAPQAIARVILDGAGGTVRHLMDPAPATMVDAQFSLPFAIAALAHRRAPAAAWFSDDALHDPALLDFAARVEAVFDPELDALMRSHRRPAGRASIVIRDEVRHSELVGYPRGGAERPLSASEVLAKFIANAAPVLGSGEAEALAQRILAVEAERDVAALLGACAGR